MKAAWCNFPENKGFMSGLIVSAYGFSGMLLNYSATAIINPDRIKPVEIEGSEGKYYEKDIVDRVPVYLLCFSIFILVGGIVSSLLISYPPEEEKEQDEKVDEEPKEVRHDRRETEAALNKLEEGLEVVDLKESPINEKKATETVEKETKQPVVSEDERSKESERKLNERELEENEDSGKKGKENKEKGTENLAKTPKLKNYKSSTNLDEDMLAETYKKLSVVDESPIKEVVNEQIEEIHRAASDKGMFVDNGPINGIKRPSLFETEWEKQTNKDLGAAEKRKIVRRWTIINDTVHDAVLSYNFVLVVIMTISSMYFPYFLYNVQFSFGEIRLESFNSKEALSITCSAANGCSRLLFGYLSDKVPFSILYKCLMIVTVFI